MNVTIEINVPEASDGPSTRTFTKLPVRFGRDDSCDVVLPYPFVSRSHARIEARGDDVVLLDEGSTNGIHHDGVRLLPHTPMKLDHEERRFSIDDVSFEIRVFEATQPVAASADSRESTSPLVTTGVDADKEMRTSLYSDQNIEPCSLDDAQRILEDYRVARRGALRALRMAIDVVDEGDRSALVRELAASFDELGCDPELTALAREHGVESPMTRTDLELEICVPGPLVPDVEELAARHVPNAGILVDGADVSVFLARVDTVLRATVDGLADLDLCSRDAPPRRALPSPSPGAELRARLLDWTREVDDVDDTIRELVGGVRERYETMTANAHLGAMNALAAISPDAMRRAAPLPWWNPFPLRSLWKTYVARYAIVANEEIQALWRSHCLRRARFDSSLPPHEVHPPMASSAAMPVVESGVIVKAPYAVADRVCG